MFLPEFPDVPAVAGLPEINRVEKGQLFFLL